MYTVTYSSKGHNISPGKEHKEKRDIKNGNFYSPAFLWDAYIPYSIAAKKENLINTGRSPARDNEFDLPPGEERERERHFLIFLKNVLHSNFRAGQLI